MASSDKRKIVHIHLGGENYKTVMTAGNHEMLSDEPESLGGQDTGPDPYDYLLMSVGSCSVITMKMYADRKEWPVEDIFIEMRHYKALPEDSEGSDDPKKKIDVIEKEITVKGNLDEKQRQRLLEISKKCPVHRTLLNSVEFRSTVEG
jgi:putative redox protein